MFRLTASEIHMVSNKTAKIFKKKIVNSKPFTLQYGSSVFKDSHFGRAGRACDG